MNRTEISYFRSSEPKESEIRSDFIDDIKEYIPYDYYKSLSHEDKRKRYEANMKSNNRQKW